MTGIANYANGKLIKGLLAQGHHLVTRAKSNSAANHLPPERPRRPKRGRTRKYGDPVRLISLYRSSLPVERIPNPVYDEKNVTIDLMWDPAERVVGTIGKRRAGVKIGLMDVAYNVKRFSCLQEQKA